MALKVFAILPVYVPTSFAGSLVLPPPEASEERPWHTLVACLSSLATRGGKIRDTGNEVVYVLGKVFFYKCFLDQFG